MAIVRKFEDVKLEWDSTHAEVQCTFSIVDDAKGLKQMQIDTY